MHNDGSKKLVKGALILAGAGLIGKVLGASYRIPLQNLLGDEGFYIYQQIYPILGLALMLSLYGFPSAVARIAAEHGEKGETVGWRNYFLPAWVVLAGTSIIFAGMLFIGADRLAEIIGDDQLVSLYRSASFVFLAIPITAILRGACQSQAEMVPVAQSQLIEQFLRVVIIIAAAAVIGKSGDDLYKIGMAAVWAAVIGAVGAIGILLFRTKQPALGTAKFSWGRHSRALLGIGLVATLNHALLLLIQFGDMLTLLPSLREYGLSFAAAVQEKGIFDRGQPLIQIGSVLGSSLALSVMPSISKGKLEREPDLYGPFMLVAFKLSLAIGIGAAAGLIVIFPEVNTLLFENSSGTGSLRLLMLAVCVSSVAITLAAMLQGLGLYRRTALYITLALLVKVFLNFTLVRMYGIYGGAAATVLALVLMLTLASFDLSRQTALFSGMRRVSWPLVLSAGSMVIYLFAGKWFFQFMLPSMTRGMLVLEVIVLVTGGAIVYLVLLFRSKEFFREEEVSLLPASKLFLLIRKNIK
ncbi:polysaccharide biosynthesis protein [Aciduricibacillus chroicocephali]|uniref:Polysaccharide biosynthesis protein n=1 Tax=Aciduricibacillus chroicocephali TaxID=3054939 RepID=A0ABY9KVI2_9BACI|nr:polysaccharide biosynthesis protein [Bacillaceae bacterium 44XB]